MYTGNHAFVMNEYEGARYMRSSTGLDEDAHMTNLWHNHFMCMDGESDDCDPAEDQAFEQGMHWVHLIS